MKRRENISILNNAEDLCLTKETVLNLLKMVTDELIAEEKYEQISSIKKKAETYLKKLQQAEKDLVTNVGLTDKQKEDLFNYEGHRVKCNIFKK